MQKGSPLEKKKSCDFMSLLGDMPALVVLGIGEQALDVRVTWLPGEVLVTASWLPGGFFCPSLPSGLGEP
jgi:hypothetical protein